MPAAAKERLQAMTADDIIELGNRLFSFKFSI